MEGMNIAVTPAIQRICYPEDIQSSLRNKARPKFTTLGGARRGASLSCQIPSLVDGNLNESSWGGRGDRRVAAWFALVALLAPAFLHYLVAALL